MNTAHEILWQLTVQYSLREEQFAFKREELAFVPPLDRIPSNSHVLGLLQKPPTGLLHLVDHEASLPRDESSLTHLKESMQESHGTHSKFRCSSFHGVHSTFAVVHSGGTVSYNASHFVQSNRSGVDRSVMKLLAESGLMLVQQLVVDGDVGSSPARGRPATEVTLFTRKLSGLVKALGQNDLSFVHCVNTELEQPADEAAGGPMAAQLQSSGLMISLKLRASSYPGKLDEGQFFKIYPGLR